MLIVREVALMGKLHIPWNMIRASDAHTADTNDNMHITVVGQFKTRRAGRVWLWSALHEPAGSITQAQ